MLIVFSSTKIGCDRQSKNAGSLRFLFEGTRVVDTDTPISVGIALFHWQTLLLRGTCQGKLQDPQAD